ncbi:zinc finger C2HC domain-containing protein 1C [Chanodichthys erythropterus]|uniref:zinc finger C2HC domain-containing protein 1C n=1 Tax=Chanodichthys erythropterus TaxID=933992 RepID=UPI00351E1B4C
MQTVPHHHLTHHFWERETVPSKLPFLYRESMSRLRSPSGTHHSSRLDVLENQEGRSLRERQHPWQHPDIIHRKKNTEQNEYVPSRRTLDKIFPLKPVLHKRAFSLSNVTKPEHQERFYSCLPALTHQAAVRHQQKAGRKLDPLNLDREHQEHKQTHLSKEIHSKQMMLQQKIFKTEETLRRVQKEKTKERNQSYLEDNRFYSNGYSDWDEERHRYGNARDDMERWEREVKRSREREGRRRPLTLEMAKSHKLEEKRDWDDYEHTAKGWNRETGNGRRERGMGQDNYVRRRSEMHNLREDDVRKPNSSDSMRRDRAHLKHERRENKEGLYQLTSRLMKEAAGSTDRIPSQRGNRLQQVELSPEEDPDAPHQLVPCNVCHRCFARERLETHMRVCEKKRPQRKVFDMSQYRAKGTELEEFMKINSRSKTPERKKNNWRQKHEAFIQTMRQGRSHEPQSVSNLNPEYVTCPHCGRKFAPGPAERHIPKCQNIKSRPAPPKQPQTSARKRTAR